MNCNSASAIFLRLSHPISLFPRLILERCMKLWLILFTCLIFAAGCSSLQEEYEPALGVTIALDKEVYQIGEPVVVNVTVTNLTRKELTLVRFDAQTVRFMMTAKESFVNVAREPVISREVIPEMRVLKGKETITRPFLFTQLSEKEGDYALIASFKGAFQDEEIDTQFSLPIGYKVSKDVAFRRDKNNGLILKEQALEIAKKSINQKNILEERAVLVPMGKSGLFTWTVMLRYTAQDGKERRATMNVDPYMGKIRPIELKDKDVPQPQQKEQGK